MDVLKNNKKIKQCALNLNLLNNCQLKAPSYLMHL